MDKNDLDDFKVDLRRALEWLEDKYEINIFPENIKFSKGYITATLEGANLGLETKAEGRRWDAAEIAASNLSIFSSDFDVPSEDDLLRGHFISPDNPTEYYKFVDFIEDYETGNYFVMENINNYQTEKWDIFKLIAADIEN